MLDCPVLAGCVHRLEYQQQRPAILGVQHVLLLREPLGAALEEFSGLALVEHQATCVARIKILQLEALPLGDAVRLNIFLDSIEDLLSRHGAASLLRKPSLGLKFAIFFPAFSGERILTPATLPP